MKIEWKLRKYIEKSAKVGLKNMKKLSKSAIKFDKEGQKMRKIEEKSLKKCWHFNEKKVNYEKNNQKVG